MRYAPLLILLATLCACQTSINRSPFRVPIWVPLGLEIPITGVHPMLFRPLLGTDLSGSVGGITASHNRGGTYFRNRAIPVNPNSLFQQAVRDAVSQLSTAWGNDLATAQRDGWEAYGAAVGVQNRIGETIFLTGQQMYIRSNVPALQAAIPRQDDAPVILDLGSFTAPTLSGVTSGPGTASIAFTNTDDWANEDDSAMLVYASRGHSPTINYPNVSMRFADKIDGDATTPPTSPASILLPFEPAVGQRVFLQGRVIRADGRLSSLWRLNGIVSGG